MTTSARDNPFAQLAHRLAAAESRLQQLPSREAIRRTASAVTVTWVKAAHGLTRLQAVVYQAGEWTPTDMATIEETDLTGVVSRVWSVNKVEITTIGAIEEVDPAYEDAETTGTAYLSGDTAGQINYTLATGHAITIPSTWPQSFTIGSIIGNTLWVHGGLVRIWHLITCRWGTEATGITADDDERPCYIDGICDQPALMVSDGVYLGRPSTRLPEETPINVWEVCGLVSINGDYEPLGAEVVDDGTTARMIVRLPIKGYLTSLHTGGLITTDPDQAALFPLVVQQDPDDDPVELTDGQFLPAAGWNRHDGTLIANRPTSLEDLPEIDATSVLANATAATAKPTAVQATIDNRMFGRVGGVLGFFQVPATALEAGAGEVTIEMVAQRGICFDDGSVGPTTASSFLFDFVPVREEDIPTDCEVKGTFMVASGNNPVYYEPDDTNFYPTDTQIPFPAATFRNALLVADDTTGLPKWEKDIELGTTTDGGVVLKGWWDTGKYWTFGADGKLVLYDSSTVNIEIGAAAGIKYTFASGKTVEISSTGKVTLTESAFAKCEIDMANSSFKLTFANSNTVELASSDITGSSKVIKLREIADCSDSGTAGHRMVLCSDFY